MLLLLSALSQIIRRGNLRHRNPADLCLQPVHKFRERDAVPYMREPGVINLDRILDRLHQLCRILFVHDLTVRMQTARNAVIDHTAIQKHAGIRRNGRHVLVNCLIRSHRYTVFIQIRPDLFRHQLLLQKPDTLCVRHCQIREYDRHMIDIASADIQKPGDIVERGEDVHTGLLLFHLFPQAGKLVRGISSTVTLFEQKQRLLRKSRTVLPDQAGQILVHMQRRALLLRNPAEFFAQLCVYHPSVKPKTTVFRKLFPDKILLCRHALHSHAVKRDGCSCKLLLRLNEITAVCPQPRLCLCDYGGSRGTCKARDKFSRLKMIPDILGFMEIGCRNHIKVNLPLSHLTAQRAKSLLYHDALLRLFYDVNSKNFVSSSG